MEEQSILYSKTKINEQKLSSRNKRTTPKNLQKHTPFAIIKVFGDYPLIKVLNYLLIYRDLDYSLTDIAEGSDVAWSTLNLLWPKLEKMKLVTHTRNVGKAKMYTLNKENSVVKQLIQFADALAWQQTQNVKQKIKTKKEELVVSA